MYVQRLQHKSGPLTDLLSSYKFRQASCFWYLTGIEEQDSAILLEKTSDVQGYRMHLFVKERDAYDELWNGPRYAALGCLRATKGSHYSIGLAFRGLARSLVLMKSQTLATSPRSSSLSQRQHPTSTPTSLRIAATPPILPRPSHYPSENLFSRISIDQLPNLTTNVS